MKILTKSDSAMKLLFRHGILISFLLAMKKFTFTLLVAILLADFYSALALEYYYTWNMPQTAQIQQGRTIAIDVFYNRTVFVTRVEKRRLDVLFIGVPVAAAAYVFVSLWLAKKYQFVWTPGRRIFDGS